MSSRPGERGAPPDPIRPAPLALQEVAPAEAWTPAQWELLLAAALGGRVEVRYGRARRAVVQSFRRGGTLVVRLNAMFAHAPPAVREALASWLRSGRRARRACALLDAWIAQALERLEPRPLRAEARRTSGACHDLAAMLRQLLAVELAAEFRHRPVPEVTWGRAGRSRSKRSLRLGSFDFHARVVRIHPVLDQEAVPGSFVRFVLFHELLHAALGEDTAADGRRVHHGAAFRARERRYLGYAEAIAWERGAIRALILSARSGRPMKAAAQRVTARGSAAALKAKGVGAPPEAEAPVEANERRGWLQRLLFGAEE